jgi:hypothetical protein
MLRFLIIAKVIKLKKGNNNNKKVNDAITHKGAIIFGLVPLIFLESSNIYRSHCMQN